MPTRIGLNRNMKLHSIATALFLLKEATSQECPNSIALEEWGETKFNDDSLTLYHAVVLASGPYERDIFCARLQSDMESYIGFAISPSGTMDKALAIIGLPGSDGESGSVQKYSLSSKERSAEPLPEEQQTLMYTNILQDDGGKTTLEFAKYLVENGEPEIFSNGENTFLWSQGKTNSLGFHTARGSFTLEYDVNRAPTSSTIAPSPAGSNGGTDIGFNDESTVVGRTTSPTGGYVPREPAAPVSPTPSPMAPAENATPAPSKSETNVPPTPPSPPDAVTQPGSGTIAKKMAGTVILGAGVIAVWFGL